MKVPRPMIRQYQPEDTDAVIAVWQRANAYAHPFLPEDFVVQGTKDMRNIYLPNAETWVLEHDGALAGFISMVGTEIGGLFLDPSLHGKGYGRAMTDHVAKSHGPLTVEVFEQNAVGRPFYDRYGFIETGRYEHEPTGEVVIKMALKTS